MAFTYVVCVLALLQITTSFPTNETEITSSIFDDSVEILNGTSASGPDLLANSSSPTEGPKSTAAETKSTQDDEVVASIKYNTPEDETTRTTEITQAPTILPTPTPTSLAALTRSSTFSSIVPICVCLLLKKISGLV